MSRPLGSGAVTARGIYARTARIYWRRAGYLLILGVAVFVPLGLLDSLANQAGEIDAGNVDELSGLGNIALATGFIAQAITSLLGEVFYAGAVALALAGDEGSDPPSLGSVARRLAYLRLIAVDIIFGVAVVIGLVALIIPGIVLFTWFALAGPVVELEGAGVRAAFRRSRQLVRGRFWTVLLVLLPITLASEALSSASLELVHLVIHSPFLSDWVGEAIANIALSPFYAVAAVLMTLGFSRAERQSATDPAGA
jgi:hypothetical protein